MRLFLTPPAARTEPRAELPPHESPRQTARRLLLERSGRLLEAWASARGSYRLATSDACRLHYLRVVLILENWGDSPLPRARDDETYP